MSDVRDWEKSYRRLCDECADVSCDQDEYDARAKADWDRRFGEMVADMTRLQRADRWRSGPRTLLAALGLQYDELKLTAALAWARARRLATRAPSGPHRSRSKGLRQRRRFAGDASNSSAQVGA